MPDIIKIATQVEVQDARLPLDDGFGHPLYRVMRCPLGTVSKRARLEVRLENRLHYELERPLNHPVPNRRNRKDADFAPILRYFLPSGWEWLVGAPDQFVPLLFEQSFRATRLDGLDRQPFNSSS